LWLTNIKKKPAEDVTFGGLLDLTSIFSDRYFQVVDLARISG